MRARAVIGANFGDEGKGLVTDYLCATQGAGMVVRFNGGAQAGHTVVTPTGARHVFHHVGSGAFCGVPTFLSQFFICNPLLLMGELAELQDIGIEPEIYAHPNCLVTTFADMFINQRKEEARGDKRHGSCGVGVNETVNRSQVSDLKITMSDLWNRVDLRDRLAKICGVYAEFRTGQKIKDPEQMIDAFVTRCCPVIAQYVHPLGIAQCREPVFEGAQGLLLDKDNKQFFPHVTRSNTGSKNVRTLCEQAKIDEIDFYYVSRTYLTRHGAGPLPGEDPNMSYDDDTNLPHQFQGALRFAPLDHAALISRCAMDSRTNHTLVMTHCDQLMPSWSPKLSFHGPHRDDVQIGK